MGLENKIFASCQNSCQFRTVPRPKKIQHFKLVKITSEKGGDCVIQNPWPDKGVRFFRNGQPAESASGPHFALKTAVGESFELRVELKGE